MFVFATFLFICFSFSSNAHAGVGSFIDGIFGNGVVASTFGFEENIKNSQTMTVLEPVLSLTKKSKVPDTAILDDTALESSVGPSGTVTEVQEKMQADKVSVYVVHDGDTLSSIAEMYDVNANTIMWANDLKSSKDIRKGDELIILPISGLKHVVLKGETIKSIATKYHGDATEIIRFNDLGDNPVLIAGTEIIIPNGEINAPSVPVKSSVAGASQGVSSVVKSGIFMRPTKGLRTQGLHGKNRSAVDIAAPNGTPVYAAAGGKVIVSKLSGWNGGYGNYIVIEHSNGMQSLYAHLSQNLVSAGSQVKQGDMIGNMGATGNSTGSHLHFEILGAKNWNPFN